MTTVRFKKGEVPAPTQEQIDRFDAIRDEDIDYSDIPELTPEWFKGAVLGGVYKPVKAPLSVKLDKDVIEWLKSSGPGYQTRMNEILRNAMLNTVK